MRLALGTKVHVFSFNSSDSNLESLKCHLELSVPSSLFGFSVFLEEMSLAGSVRSGCPHDFVQFGRDILFVTTHMSSKYCGDIETPVTTEVAGVTKIHFPVTPLASRIYREDSDREMDIWIHVTKEDQVDKIISMVRKFGMDFKKTLVFDRIKEELRYYLAKKNTIISQNILCQPYN